MNNRYVVADSFLFDKMVSCNIASKPLTAPPVEESDTMPAASSACAGGIKSIDVWIRFLTRWWVFDYTFINSI